MVLYNNSDGDFREYLSISDNSQISYYEKKGVLKAETGCLLTGIGRKEKKFWIREVLKEWYDPKS